MSKPLLRLPPLKGFRGSPGDRIHKAVGLLAQPDQVSLYEALISCWTAPVVRGRRAPGQQLPEAPGLSFAERMMLCDTVGYLPNDILVKVDRAAMATSLETRVPILDPDVYRLAWSLPLAWRVGSGPVGKVVLRELLARYVPRPLFERPKTGFGVPLESWLRGPLRTWADDLLSPERLRAQGLLDVDLVSRTWAEHRSGRRNWQHLLWSVLMFQLWFEEWSVAPAATSVSR